MSIYFTSRFTITVAYSETHLARALEYIWNEIQSLVSSIEIHDIEYLNKKKGVPKQVFIPLENEKEWKEACCGVWDYFRCDLVDNPHKRVKNGKVNQAAWKVVAWWVEKVVMWTTKNECFAKITQFPIPIFWSKFFFLRSKQLQNTMNTKIRWQAHVEKNL